MIKAPTIVATSTPQTVDPKGGLTSASCYGDLLVVRNKKALGEITETALRRLIATSEAEDMALIESGKHPLLSMFITNEDWSGMKNMLRWIYEETRARKVQVPACASKAPPPSLRQSLPNPQIMTRPKKPEIPEFNEKTDFRAAMIQMEMAALVKENTLCCCIQRDIDLATSHEVRVKMIDKLWKIFDVEDTDIQGHTTKQLANMRFLELHHELLHNGEAPERHDH